MRGQIIVGRLATGIGHGVHFTRLEWARLRFIEKLGIDPFPGTVNLIVDDPKCQPVWERLKSAPGVRIANPNQGPRDCDARCYPISIEGRIDAAIVVPEVADYPHNLIEIIATVGIRGALGIADGDLVALEISLKSRDSKRYGTHRTRRGFM